MKKKAPLMKKGGGAGRRTTGHPHVPIEPRAHLAAIVDSSDDAIISKTLEGIVTSWNAAATRLFGYTAEEMVGKSIKLLIPPERLSEETEILNNLRRGKKVNHLETVRIDKHGNPLHVSLTISPIRDGQGKIIGASKIMRNIGERLESERHALKAQAAELANRTKSEFLANMSHEIRTPMTAIIGYADILLDASLNSSDRLNAVNIIRRNGEHLLTIINDILDLSKIEAGEMKVETIPCKTCQIICDIVSAMRVRAKEKNLSLEMKVEGMIPEVMRTDPTRVRQILINLIGNAIKFTEAGGVRVVVKMADSPKLEKPHMQFKVIDTGIGMEAEQIGSIFLPFAQGNMSTTRRFGGTGLGLSISRRLAQALGGDIVVSSVPGKGSTFTATVETGTLEGVKMLQDCSEVLADVPMLQPQKMITLTGHVLLADDGADNRSLLSAYLIKAGASVSFAENGRIAHEKVVASLKEPGAQRYDIVLMDMQMPELDGYGATAKIRAAGYTGPVIALTAHAMAKDRDKCLRAGCTDYLSKPVRREQFLNVVAKHLMPASAESHETGEVLRSDLPDKDIQPLIRLYIAQLPGVVSELRRRLIANNQSGVTELAHNLRGTGGMYGFMPISEAAGRVESLLEAGSPGEEIAEAVERLINTLRLVEGYDRAKEVHA